MFKKRISEKKYEEKNLITLIDPTSIISEEFRTLRTNIQFSMIDKELKTLMVTSSKQGEGKSTIAANLAVVFASQGKKVLLVDADMRNPSLHKLFKVRNQQGLTSILTTKNRQLRSLLHETSQENLNLLTSGILPPNPSELLASQRMAQFIEAVKQEYDLIVFDMPPVNVVTDAQVMGNKADGTVFVIRKEVADLSEILKAKELLNLVQANVLGAVFNSKERVKGLNGGYYAKEKELDTVG
ncbi:CpsD/CapB family tyrosine-protein kinase [Carnobacterium viridans]|uniref:Tyrosine-protein kinase CpsD n=1 Tax=Carnobacterium viridans TaxID=174587 RepID=A0A1H0YCU2_9LACT|nr:CpsD/CapB family tyrosine-protein kinase [Carnobacterium viridans]UDE95220.1 CpsD/CapB family tyrosine-protein kinase [Carnobacterium viridans]SDQ12716.1 capsular exopolysaccharide family [Carnobacterium viridans]